MTSRLPFCLVAALLLAPCSAQEVLQRWNFSRGKGNWFAANSCAPLTVEEGRLVVRVIGFDPYVHSSRGTDFRIDAGPGVFIRMKARCNVSSPAEFFWAETTEGQDAGFVGGREIRFFMHGDGRFHTYTIFPGWKDTVTRLRFDPPGGKDQGVIVEIVSVEIVQIPVDPGPHGPVWNFAGSLAGFSPSSYIEHVAIQPDAISLTGFGPTATLVSGDVALQTEKYPWLTLHAEVDVSTVLTVMWRNAEGDYCKERARIRLLPGKTRHTVRLNRFQTWSGTITGLRIQWPAVDEPVRLNLQNLTLAETPAGPPQLEILAVGTDRAVSFLGQPVVVQITTRNAGSTPLAPASLPISCEGQTLAQLQIPQLAAGQTATLTQSLSLETVGDHRLTIRAPEGESDRTILALVVPRLSTHPADRKGLSVESGQVVLNAGRVRLRGPVQNTPSPRYGPLFVEVLGEKTWKQVAVLPACGGLQVAGERHRELPWGNLAANGDVQQKTPATLLRLETTHRDRTGVSWRSTAEYRLTGDPERILMRHTLAANATGKLLRYDGPVLRVGDGTFGNKKYEALFPGLEYLSSYEVSSSDRDILPPGDLRAIPHPNRICIPSMALASPDHDLIALLWDNEQTWLADHDQPSAVFASPNLVENGDPRLAPMDPPPVRTGNNHLMGLFVPSIPMFLEENGVRAETPVQLERQNQITLESTLFVRPGGEVLDAVDAWLEQFNPAPIGNAPMPMDQHYALSVRAFEEILYTEGEGWAGVKGWEPKPNPGTALLYLYLAAQLGRPNLRQTAIQRIGTHPALPLSLHIGGVSDAVQTTHASGLRTLSRREPDGNWVFRPSEKTASLGKAGDTNVGMAAGSVRHILRAAALSADPLLLREGLEGLTWLRKWRVPRGAQVWEIPLHAPDILASAHCCAAFLWGYRLTNDESYLQDAVYWARTGLPFIYFWQTPQEGLEPMRGGTIPIFGATFYVGSWYGRLVQWCGLEYARALIALASYDQTHQWRTIARDITVSGWRQQQQKDNFQGLYPDSWSLLTGAISWGLMLGPQRLVHNQLALDGLAPNGDTRLFRRGNARVTVMGPGKFMDLSVGTKGDGRRMTPLPKNAFDLTFRHRFSIHPDSLVAVVGVTKPRTVQMNGATLAWTEDLDRTASAWTWSPTIRGVIIKLRSPEQKTVQVTIRGLDVPPPAECTNGVDIR